MEKIMERATICAALQRAIGYMAMNDALAELMVASAELEFEEDPEGVLRHWVTALPDDDYTAEDLLATMYVFAQRCTHGAGEYEAAVNAYFALRAALGMDVCRGAHNHMII